MGTDTQGAQEYRLAIETCSDGFWIADRWGRLLEANAAYVQASGYTREALLGLRMQDLEDVDSGQNMGLHLEQAIRNGHARFVSTHRNRDGQRWPVEMVVSYVPLEGGRFFCFLRDLTEQQKSAELIWHQANFDRLTDLPNRALFFDRLSQECSAARRSAKRVALLYADLDAFKPVNDRFGHAAGDTALQAVAARWQSCVRGTDTIARLGGDEFAIIAGAIDSQQEAAAIADKLIDALRQDIDLPAGQHCRVGVSIGIALYPDNAVELDALLSAADRAMFACKAQGKNAFAFASTPVPTPPERGDWIDFQEAHLVGVGEIDAQHRQLVRMVNDLKLGLGSDTRETAIRQGLEGLMAFTQLHFQTEHRYMLTYRYPDLKAHTQEHAKQRDALQKMVECSDLPDALLQQRLTDWLLTHVQPADKALGRYLQDCGVS